MGYHWSNQVIRITLLTEEQMIPGPRVTEEKRLKYRDFEGIVYPKLHAPGGCKD